jgi:hypothetical protein
MSSKYLSSLSSTEYSELTNKLWNIQNKACFICTDSIDLELHSTNIDHIIPLANKGKDSEENFAVTHESCNKSKQDSNLNIARILHKLKRIQDTKFQRDGKSASLKDVLENFGGGKFNFRFRAENSHLEFSLGDVGDNSIQSSRLFNDALSGVQTCFVELPIEYIHHDDLINPRGINSSISKLIKEFDKRNPQLHLSLARIDGDKVKVFDGQHKAVAQVLLGARKLLLRLFIDTDVDVLTETNTNAGSTLRQIAFDKSIMRQLNNTLYLERIKQYQHDHNLKEDDFSFSEQKLVDYFKGDNANIKKYIIDNIKHSITEAPDNKLKDYLDREGKGKELPISYSAFDKTFLTFFVDNKKILAKPINFKSDEGLNPREVEISQIVKLLNILAEEIYINRFSPEVGIYRIEDKIVKGQDVDITDDHLIAYRMSKEEIMYNWLLYLKAVIKNYFSNKESFTTRIRFSKNLSTNSFGRIFEILSQTFGSYRFGETAVWRRQRLPERRTTITGRTFSAPAGPQMECKC